MASSSDPERDSNKSPPKSDNPFIKFRQFADRQISSLLQGIVGLPSAFSGKPSENTRWSVFDEDPRRRDELQARKQELRESEAKGQPQATSNDAGTTTKKSADGGEDIPVKKPTDWGSFSRRHDTSQTTSQDNDGMKDLPLYSPVTKPLFAHLHRPSDGNKDWKQRDRLVDLDSSILLDFFPELRKDQQAWNNLRTTQYLVYNQLNRSSTLRSEYSLLPYLMFSPYSPIRLTENKSMSQSQQDTFPYCHAFEDLIRTTQQPQKPNLLQVVFGNHFPIEEVLDLQRSFDIPITKAATYHTWIQSLQRSGILQESETRSEPRPLRGLLSSLHFPGLDQSKPEPFPTNTKSVSKEEQSELDMYESFLRWATQSNGFQEVAKFKMDQVQNEFWRALDRAADGAMPSSEEEHQEFVAELELARQKAERMLKIETSNSVDDPEKVISEHTVTQRMKQADGTVETHVSVWKKFADGRETTTTTSHTEEQERDEGNFKAQSSIGEEAERLSETGRSQKAKEDPEKKKGWFWN